MGNLHKGLHLFRQLLKQMAVGFFGVNPFYDAAFRSVISTEVNIKLSADYAFTQQLEGRSWKKNTICPNTTPFHKSLGFMEKFLNFKV